MYLTKSNILLLTTALLTSIVIATRPSDATPVSSLGSDVGITQNDINNNSVDEDVYSVVKRDVWADAHDLLASASLAKSKVGLAKRADVLATTTKYNTKTLTTDVASPTTTIDEKSANHVQVKAKTNTNTHAHQSTFSAPAAMRPSNLEAFQGIAETIMPPGHKHTEIFIKDTAKPLASEPLATNMVKPPSTPDFKSNSPAPSSQPIPNPISANPNTNNVKRGLGTYEYIYDSTTVLVTATSVRGLTDKVPSQTRKLRYGILASPPTTEKSG